MDTLRERAAARPMRVAFPEGGNETMMRAVAELTEAGLARCVLVGDGAELSRLAAERGVSLEGVEVVDVTDEAGNAACAERYLAHPDCRYKPKGVARRMTRPLERALIMQVLGDVDVMFAGIVSATGDIILAAQTIVGLADGVDTISSGCNAGPGSAPCGETCSDAGARSCGGSRSGRTGRADARRGSRAAAGSAGRDASGGREARPCGACGDADARTGTAHGFGRGAAEDLRRAAGREERRYFPSGDRDADGPSGARQDRRFGHGAGRQA